MIALLALIMVGFSDVGLAAPGGNSASPNKDGDP